MLTHTVFQQPLPAEVLGDRGGRRPAGDPAPDPARGAPAPLERQTRWRSRRVADVPAGTGLGSSGAYTVCLLKALAIAGRGRSRPAASPRRRARSRSTSSASRSASRTSTSSAHGGICAYTFDADGTRRGRAARASTRRRCDKLRDNLLLFYTGETRSAVGDPRRPGRRGPSAATRRWSRTCIARRRSGSRVRALLESGDLERLRRAHARALGRTSASARPG